MVNEYIEKELCSVSENQAKQIKELHIKKQLSEYELHKILCGDVIKEKLYLETKRLRRYFPSSYTIQQCEETIWDILEKWFKKK